MTADEVKKLAVYTTSREAPFERRFNDEEVAHILSLLTPEKAKNIQLKHEFRGGSDLESYHFIGIRRKDGKIPKKLAHVYKFFLCVSSGVGFDDPAPQRLIEELKIAGASD